jgi:hypothetical protein
VKEMRGWRCEGELRIGVRTQNLETHETQKRFRRVLELSCAEGGGAALCSILTIFLGYRRATISCLAAENW